MRHVTLLIVCALAACGGNNKGGANCTATGTACTADGDCCTDHCDTLSGVCAHVPGACLMSGDTCSAGPDCCSFSCINNKCSGNQCTSDNAACSGNDECCSGLCSNGACAALNAACKTSGNTCSGDGDCCSKFCKSGVCNNAPSYCIQDGDTCSTDAECCGGMCSVSGTATLGLCIKAPASGATDCATAGELCGAGTGYMGGPLPTCGGECCSRACFPYGATGALICQPPSGCRPTGELCTQDSDCCGGLGQPDSTSNVRCEKIGSNPVGRCDNGNSCSPAGAICRLQSMQCNANANCCAGNVLQKDTCHQDNLGIPRCLEAEIQCTDPSQYVGKQCATSADCCGLPCVKVPGTEFDFVCGASCRMTGDSCTTAADCCSGLPCNIPPGASSGTCGTSTGCAAYGQACTMASDCCNNVACNGGKCVDIIQ